MKRTLQFSTQHFISHLDLLGSTPTFFFYAHFLSKTPTSVPCLEHIFPIMETKQFLKKKTKSMVSLRQLFSITSIPLQLNSGHSYETGS